MAEYYQVPEVVYQYYPELIDDYIRAATGAAKGSDYDVWEDVGGRIFSGAAQGFSSTVADYTRQNAEERAYRRKLDFETQRQEQMEARQRAVLEAKEAAQQQAAEMKRAARMGALQDFYLRRAPKMVETAGVQGFDAEGNIDQRPPREEMQYPSEMPMATWEQMMRENPEQAILAAEGFAEYGKGGAFGDALKGALMTPSAQNIQSQIDSRGRRDDLAESKEDRLYTQFNQTHARLLEGQALLEKYRDQVIALRNRGQLNDDQLTAANLKLKELQEELIKARTNQANANAAKASRPGGTGGPRVLTASQQNRMDLAKRWADMMNPDASDEEKADLTRLYYEQQPWKPSGGTNETVVPTKNGDQVLMKNVRKPGQAPNPWADKPSATPPAADYESVKQRAESLPSVSEEGLATLRQLMNQFTPEQQAEISAIISKKPIKKSKPKAR